MKTKGIGFLPALCFAALTLSCVAPQPETTVTMIAEGDDIIAGIEAGAPATKTVVEDLNVLWSKGDLLSVFSNSTGNSKYTLKSGAGKASGVFRKVKDSTSGEDYSGYVAVYPYDEAVALDADGTVSLVLPATQTYAEDSFGPGANAMVAWSEDTRLSFFNVGSFLMLKLHGNACISSIELTALGGESLAGPVQVVLKDGVPAAEFTKDAEACPSVTLLCDEVVQLDEEEDTPFWIVVPPVILSEGFKVTVTCEHGQVVELPYPKEAEFIRNQVFRMAPAEVTVEKTYLDYLSEDYRTLAANYPNAKDHFVEARYVLNDIIADNETEDLKAESVMLICYCWLESYSEIDVFERNFTTGETEVYQYFADSPWLGDMLLSESELKAFKFSLDDAILNAKNDEDASSGDGLDTRNITLRKPLWPVWENTQYVIGGSASRLDHVFVDAVDGTVTTLEGGAGGGGSSLEYLMEDTNILRDMYWMDEILGFPLEIRDFISEARYILNLPMNAGQVAEIWGKEVTYVYYVPASESVSDNYVIRGTRDLIKGFSSDIVTEAEVFTGEWPTYYYLTPDDRDNLISLEDAIYIVKLGNVTDPDTAEVLLCKTGETANPRYIFFGNANPTIIVDGITGEFITE